MLFGDAKQSMDQISHHLEEQQDRLTGAASGSGADEHASHLQEPEVFPEPVKVIGILRERMAGLVRVKNEKLGEGLDVLQVLWPK